MNQKLKDWLASKDRNYNQGFKLFVDLKVNPKKEKFFTTEEPTSLQKNILFSLLLNWDRIYNQPKKEKTPEQPAVVNASKNLDEVKNKMEVVEKEISNGRAIIEKNPKVKYEDLPDDLKSAFDFNTENYPIIAGKHAKIRALGTDVKFDPDRKTLMNEVLDTQKVIKENWAKIDAWVMGEGKEPEAKTPIEPSGKYTLEEIEAMEDPTVKALSKEKRIDANLKYIRTESGKENKKEQVEKRIAELTTWGINYEERIGANSGSGAGK